MQKLINRDCFLKQLVHNKDVDLVKIVTGVRRCGKSTLLDLYHNYLLDNNVLEEQIIHMNLESLKYEKLQDYHEFYSYIAAKIVQGKRYYLLFDEIQHVDGWQKAIESFRLDFDVDIYLTGSNAYLLSGELATFLSGRYLEIKMLPLSFCEFKALHTFAADISEDVKFKYYLQFGGMPVLGEYALDVSRSQQALEGIYATVILKDVLQRHPAADAATLHKIMRFLCSNIGSVTSPNNIGNVLSHEGDIKNPKRKNMAGKTVEKYLGYLQDAFVVYSAERYDIKGKLLLKTLGKNYLVDMGFRNLLLGYRDGDIGHILENIVYLELLRREYSVHIGKYGETEVDFVAEKVDEKIYIQVTESMLNEATRIRELRPLQLIRDNYEKWVLSLDQNFISSYEGIKAINIIDWLNENSYC